MVVKLSDERAGSIGNAQGNTALSELSHHRCRYHVVWKLPTVHRLAFLLVLRLSLGILNQLMQIWRCIHLPVSVACDESRINLCAVLVFDRNACAYVVARAVTAEKRKLRCEKKIPDSSLFVEVDDPRHDRERRIVENRTAFGIVEILEIAARVKRSNAFVLVYAVSVTRPFLHSLIHVIGRVAVICCQLRLELACKRFVILVRFSSIGR